MIFKSAEAMSVPAFGVAQRKTLAVGERMLVTEFSLPRDEGVPHHHHPYEEVGYLVSGSLRLRIGTQEDTVKAGDSWYIPANTGHTLSTTEGAVFVAIFSPPRGDYR